MACRGVRGGVVTPTVCISAGGNDIDRVRRYREALGRVRDLGGIPVMCGILPRSINIIRSTKLMQVY